MLEVAVDSSAGIFEFDKAFDVNKILVILRFTISHSLSFEAFLIFPFNLDFKKKITNRKTLVKGKLSRVAHVRTFD